MAKEDKQPKKKRQLKPSMRDLAEKNTSGSKRKMTGRRAKASSRLGKLSAPLKKEFHPIKLPDNKAGRFLGRRPRLVPKFLSEAWKEIRQVTWPNRNETIRLTFAVFVFSIIFAVIVASLDFVLDKIFRTIISS